MEIKLILSFNTRNLNPLLAEFVKECRFVNRIVQRADSFGCDGHELEIEFMFESLEDSIQTQLDLLTLTDKLNG